MKNMEKYSDNKLKQMIQNAVASQQSTERINVSTLESMKAWLNLFGYGQIADLMTISINFYFRIRNIIMNNFDEKVWYGNDTSRKVTYYGLYLKNDSYGEVNIALHYCDLAGNWNTHGWVKLSPGTKLWIADTTAPDFYIYAIGDFGNWIGETEIPYGGENYLFKKHQVVLKEVENQKCIVKFSNH